MQYKNRWINRPIGTTNRADNLFYSAKRKNEILNDMGYL